MRIAFIHIPRYLCAVEVQRNPRLALRPLIVGDDEQPRLVFDCSYEAGLEGVRSGMPIRRALALCREAIVIAPDPVLYSSRWQLLLDTLARVSPEVESESLGGAYLNAGGLRLHYQGEDDLAQHVSAAVHEATGLDVAIGLASGKFVAFAAAQGLKPREARVIQAGKEKDFLAPLSVDVLPVSRETVYRLNVLGLSTLGSIAEIPAPLLQSQFGFEGNRVWKLSNGQDDEMLRPRLQSEVLQAALVFDEAVGGIEMIVAAAKQLLSRLRPPLRGRSVRELTLEAELVSQRGWSRHIVLREAVSEEERLTFVLRSALQNVPPPQEVQSLSLRLGGLGGETGKQMALGQRGPLQEQLEEAIKQLKVRYGYSPIFRCVDIDPWSVVPEDRQILVESDV